MAIIKSSTFIFAAAALLLSSSVDGASIRGSTSATNNSSNNKQFLSHADDQQGDRVLFAQRNLRKKKGGDKGTKGSGTSVGANQNSFVVPSPATPLAPAPAPGPSMGDWVNECYANARAVQSCKGSDPNNYCGMCLKALASVGTAATNYNGGIKSCSSSSCGGCDTSILLPFFECGLVVEGKAPTDAVFVGNSLPVPTPAVAPVSPPPPTNPPTDDIEAKTDKINCPAVFPGSGATCVMIGSYEYKVCAYYDRGLDASCGCSAVQPIWSCTGVTKFDPIVLEAVEEEDLTVAFVEEVKEIIVNEVGEDVIVDVVDVVDVDVVDVGVVDVDIVDADIVDEVNVDADIVDEVNVDADIVDEVTPALPSVFVDVVINSIDVESLCPTEEEPKTGDICSAGGFDSIECCYADLVSEVEDATKTCECDNDASNPTFTCYIGAESTCKLL
jgi:hypothetical protein